MLDRFTDDRPKLAILGVRGVPAAHGGFETFAAQLAPYLANQNWDVRVYCQETDPVRSRSRDEAIWESSWENVTRVHVAVSGDSAVNSIRFDWRCISHVIENRPHAVLILGYNTAVFALRLRLAGIPIVINMDGMEWTRQKWGPLEKTWLYLNERAGCLLAHHLVADHPQIERHLQTRTRARKITVIPYGSDMVERGSAEDTAAHDEVLNRVGVASKRFVTLIARPEPENSILEVVRAFSLKPRNIQLVVLGSYYPETVRYHAEVLEAAGSEVVFPGAIYDKVAVETLRRHSLFYIHGHRVGGCNPSLLEAMGAGNPVLAHDNKFNRWVVQDGALYWSDATTFDRALEEYLMDAELLVRHGQLNRLRAREVFNWPEVLQSYSELLQSVRARFGEAGNSGWGRRERWHLDASS